MQQTVATSSGSTDATSVVPKLVCLVHWLVLAGAGYALMPAPASWDARCTRYIALLGLSAVSVAHILGLGWPVNRRSLTGWAALILTLASVLAVATGAGPSRLELLAAGELGLACTLNAAACTLLLQGSARGALRFSPRVIAALVVGVVGLVFAAFSSRRGPASIAAASVLTGVAIISLAICAALLEVAATERNRLQEARIARDLLTGTLLSMVAIACTSLAIAAGSIARTPEPISGDATWTTAIAAARLGWLHVFAITLPLVLVFMRRTELAGLGALAATGNWPTLVLVCVAGVGWARYQLSASARQVFSLAQQAAIKADLEGKRVSARPRAVATPAASTEIVKAPETVAVDAVAVDAAAPPNTAAAEVPDATDGAPPARIRIAGVSVDGMHEADAYGGVERRFNLLEDCVTKYPDQSGQLTARVTIDEKGSVTRVVPTEGDLHETKLGQCLMLAFYRMGFASAKDGSASFILTLRVSLP